MATAFISGYNPSPESKVSRASNSIRSSLSESGKRRFVDLSSQKLWDISAIFVALTESEKNTLVDWIETNELTEIDLDIGDKTYRGYRNPDVRLDASPDSPMTWTVVYSFEGIKL